MKNIDFIIGHDGQHATNASFHLLEWMNHIFKVKVWIKTHQFETQWLSSTKT